MRHLGHTRLLVKMELHQLFEIYFRVSAHPDQQHQFCAALRHFVEGVLGDAPEAVAAGRHDALVIAVARGGRL